MLDYLNSLAEQHRDGLRNPAPITAKLIREGKPRRWPRLWPRFNYRERRQRVKR
jgi:hypothetical protein